MKLQQCWDLLARAVPLLKQLTPPNVDLVADCWIGCDRTLPLKLKVNELTRAEREGRTNRGKALPLDGDEEAAAVQAIGEGSDADEEASGESGEHLKL